MRNYTSHREAIVQRARELVVSKGLTLQEAAEYLDIPRASLQNWLEGTSRSSVPNKDGSSYDPAVYEKLPKMGPYDSAKRRVNLFYVESFFSHSDGLIEKFSGHQEWRVTSDEEEHSIWQPYLEDLRSQGWVVRWISPLAVFLAIHPEKPKVVGIIRATILDEDRADEDLRILPEGIYDEV